MHKEENMFLHFTIDSNNLIRSYAYSENKDRIFDNSYIIDTKDIKEVDLDTYNYKYVDGDFIIVSNKKEIAEKEIIIEKYLYKIYDLEHILGSDDYKIIKCYEYSLVGKELPYDINELHKERQSMRDEINRLSNEVDRLRTE